MTRWISVTDLGDAALMLPLAFVCAVWIYASDRSASVRWLLSLTLGALLVGATKFLHAGCGIEIPAVHFRVISGHAMLSSAVWTVVIALLVGSANSRWHRAGAMLGLLLAAAIGVGRVVEHAHTTIEIVLGWTLGSAIALTFLRRFFNEPRSMPRPLAAGAVLLAISSIAYGHHAPFQRIIVQYSPSLCRWLES
ncbi:phosphatase PAP2 family protein [Paraburkholderia sp. BL10I2N1]|uniref:phosphatase PAP2 family protein n=1 Tax=Paraburkholderia sp. BL10I2N1 TaxID=1938796 RepID=UPI00105B4429|nr:phosphatase PAP2 family protein [Paraburkholderia sp. BL10I2N1]TDN67472.1 PAP2 superfamily protein [Paraburkholderia sp. BL10I2N1]